MSTRQNKDISIDVHHLTRVEGHGNIKVNVSNGKIEECRWEVPEAPRFFEAMVVGRKWYELAHITSRICGICSIAHTFASLKTTEAALGIEISEQSLKLRKILLHAENIQSHILHVGYLALPDLLGVGSVIPLASTHKQELLTVIRVHRASNEVCDILGGRTTHPVRCVVGGFCALPSEKELKVLRDKFSSALDDLQALADFSKNLISCIPNFHRETEYIALTNGQEYALYEGDIGSTDTGKTGVENYLQVTNEYVVPQSTAKYTKHSRSSYMVGALARFNLNYEKLSPKAKQVADLFGLKPLCTNPYMNSIAQLVECVHNAEDSINLIDQVLDEGIKEEIVPEKDSSIKLKEGRGVGAVEAPRGILFHDYQYDSSGSCIKANCVIPTNQNHANVQKDMEKLVSSILDLDEKKIELTLEMLVRAYDPCISCSTHYLDVQFVK
ncbi:MAG: Ni/Fe hydrogenase subunit alpha [Candidatus Aerophobetes bacterium]|nr:Ni/Fe hydrogenase subunit alpha [Candidatus Aerophobetes bacterium]